MVAEGNHFYPSLFGNNAATENDILLCLLEVIGLQKIYSCCSSVAAASCSWRCLGISAGKNGQEVVSWVVTWNVASTRDHEKICLQECSNFGGQIDSNNSNNNSLLMFSLGCLSLELAKVTL